MNFGTINRPKLLSRLSPVISFLLVLGTFAFAAAGPTNIAIRPALVGIEPDLNRAEANQTFAGLTTDLRKLAGSSNQPFRRRIERR